MFLQLEERVLNMVDIGIWFAYSSVWFQKKATSLLKFGGILKRKG